MAALKTGYTVIVQSKIGETNTPVYPITKTANVYNATGKSLDEVLETITGAENFGNFVPDIEEEANNLRFLRNDNTWQTIQSASTERAGVTQLSDATNLEDSSVAATAKAVKTVKDAVNALSTNVTDNYVKSELVGAANGIATLDGSGKVPAVQLPGFVDDVVEVNVAEDLTSATNSDGDTIVPESGKIYVDAVGDAASNKTYRWSGSKFVVISDTIALGETSSTAFDGARGMIAYNHASADHARVDATLTEASANNGYIKINGSDVLVYTHPTVDGASATNPHGTTKEDVGLGKVENKTPAEVIATMTSDDITGKLGFTPANAATLASPVQNGIMSSTYAKKVEGTMEMKLSTEEPTFNGDGLWLQIIPDGTNPSVE